MWQNLCNDLIRRKIMDGPTKTIWRALYCKLNCRPITFYTCQSFLYQFSQFAHITAHSSFNPLRTLQPRTQSIEDRFTQDQYKCSCIYHLLILVAQIQQHNRTRQYSLKENTVPNKIAKSHVQITKWTIHHESRKQHEMQKLPTHSQWLLPQSNFQSCQLLAPSDDSPTFFRTSIEVIIEHLLPASQYPITKWIPTLVLECNRQKCRIQFLK